MLYQVNDRKFTSLALANDYARTVGALVMLVWS